jgi:hypothetical protein
MKGRPEVIPRKLCSPGFTSFAMIYEESCARQAFEGTPFIRLAPRVAGCDAHLPERQDAESKECLRLQ